MNTMIRRIADRFAPKVQPDFLRHPRQPPTSSVRDDRYLALEASTCQRTLTVSGRLMEVVRLDGIRDGLSEEELEKFVQSFPVETISRAERHSRRRSLKPCGGELPGFSHR